MTRLLRLDPRLGLALGVALVVLGAGVIWFGIRPGTPVAQVDDFAVLPTGTAIDERILGTGPGFWDVTQGDFRALDGGLIPTAANSTAVLSSAPPPRWVEARFDGVGDGSGIMMRYVDSENHWTVAASETFGTWSVTKRVNGVTSFVGNTSLSLHPDRPTTLTVQFEGNVMVILVDGVPRLTVTDDALMSATTVGMTTGPADLATVWRSFSASEA